jgi:hypothetical protein
MGSTVSTEMPRDSESLNAAGVTDTIEHVKLSDDVLLRNETILIPEDLEDIHIESSVMTDIPVSTKKRQSQSSASSAVTPDLLICEISDASHGEGGGDCPASNTRYGKGKHWKKNQKKQKEELNRLSKKAGIQSENPSERTQEQRRAQVRPIIDKLTELQMNMSYPAIRELYKVLNHFIKTGEDTKIKIPFPEFSRKIKGELSNAPYISCWVKLEME